MLGKVATYHRALTPSVTEEQLNDFLRCLRYRKVAKGQLLQQEGTVCNYVSFINTGLVRIFLNTGSEVISLGFLGPGKYISAYESFLTRRPSQESMDAMEDTEVLQLSYSDMQRLYQQHPVFQECGRKVAEELFIMLNQRVTALLMLSPEQRYESMIAAHPDLLNHVPQYMLASFIGITPRHLSRIRAMFAKRNRKVA